MSKDNEKKVVPRDKDFDFGIRRMFEYNIEERTKLRREKHAVDKFNMIIAEREKNIDNELFEEYFKYQNPSHMYKVLNETKKTQKEIKFK